MKQVAVLIGEDGWPIKTIDFIGENPEPTWKVMSLEEYDNYCRKLQGLPPTGSGFISHNDEAQVIDITAQPSVAVEEQKIEADEKQESEQPKRGRGRPRKVALDDAPFAESDDE